MMSNYLHTFKSTLLVTQDPEKDKGYSVTHTSIALFIAENLLTWSKIVSLVFGVFWI